MRALLIGGSTSGKSRYAQSLAKQLAAPGRPLYYLATMSPGDDEDRARIRRHRAERAGWGFQTIEQPRDMASAAERVRGGVVLLDSVTSLLSNEMFPQGEYRPDAEKTAFSGLQALLEAAADILLVSDHLFSDALLYPEWTEAFRRAQGHLHQRLAKECDLVIRVRYGLLDVIKASGPAEAPGGGMEQE